MNDSTRQAQQALEAVERVQRLYAAQRAACLAQPYPSADERLERLRALKRQTQRYQDLLAEAMSADFGFRPAAESKMLDLLGSVLEANHAVSHLKRWMKPSKRSTELLFLGNSVKVLYQPKGVVGVIVPWNFPIYLAMGPLVTALAAGNRVMIKMSESTPATGRLLKDLLARIFPEDQVAVVLGEVDVGVAFSKLPFDHLLFTGATSVGKHVMRAAAENLTPVTLELGGKSPAIVSDSVPMKDAAERIAFGKSLNAGQTCVAPDYVLVPSRRVEEFVSQYKEVVQGFFPRLSDNPDYTAIINERQLGRLRGYLDDAREKGATLVPLFAEGQQRRLPQTLLLNVSDDMKVMQEEIFGPLLPVIPYERLEDALAYVNQRPRPLALYYFGYDKAQQQRVLHETHSGGVCLNDTLLHVAQDDIPFGGVGPSGMGHYHGHEGFLTFSKAKGVFSKPRFNAARMIYPPYGKSIQKLVYKLFVR